MNEINRAIIELSQGDNVPLQTIIKKLQLEKETILVQAGQRISFLNGQIELLKALLENTDEENNNR